MADRGKGIPLEKRINISGKMGRVVFAVTAVTAAVFWLSGSAAAMEAQEPKDGERYGAELRITREWKEVPAGFLGDSDNSGTGCQPASGAEDGVYRCGRG